MILKRSGGFIPGIRPGKETGDFLDKIMSLITLPGSVFLALLAILTGSGCIFDGCSSGMGIILWGYFASDYGGCSNRYRSTSKFLFIE